MGWVCARGRQWAKSRGYGGHTYQGGPVPQGGRGEAAGTHSPSGGFFFLRSRWQRVRLPPDGGVGQVGLKGPSSLCITGLGWGSVLLTCGPAAQLPTPQACPGGAEGQAPRGTGETFVCLVPPGPAQFWTVLGVLCWRLDLQRRCGLNVCLSTPNQSFAASTGLQATGRYRSPKGGFSRCPRINGEPGP